MSKLPNLSMEIDQSVGLNETEYLKRPEVELPKSTPEVKIKKKRVVSQKQLDSLKKAREASVAKRKPAKEAKWNKRFSDEEHIRIDERNKLLDLVKQMEEGEKKANKRSVSSEKKKAVKAPFDANHYLSNNRPSRDINWDNCFSPRRGGNNFF